MGNEVELQQGTTHCRLWITATPVHPNTPNSSLETEPLTVLRGQEAIIRSVALRNWPFAISSNSSLATDSSLCGLKSNRWDEQAVAWPTFSLEQAIGTTSPELVVECRSLCTMMANSSASGSQLFAQGDGLLLCTIA